MRPHPFQSRPVTGEYDCRNHRISVRASTHRLPRLALWRPTHDSPGAGTLMTGPAHRRITGSQYEGLERHLGEVIGSRVLHYALLTSTMDEAARQADSGAPDGLVVLADSQTAGRGRHGRSWESSPAEDLLVSVLLFPRPGFIHQLLMLAALSAAQVAEDIAGVRATLKWPNDVRVGGRKLCGVLAETRQGADARLMSVLGIGLNVNLDPARAPAGIQPASLRSLTGAPVSRLAAFRSLIRSLDRSYARLVRGESLVPEWSARLETIGKEVTVSPGGHGAAVGVIKGVAEGVDDLGRLLVRDAAGIVWPLSAGEVTLQSPQ